VNRYGAPQERFKQDEAGFFPTVTVLYFVHHLAYATELDVDTMDKPNQIKSSHLTCYLLCRSVFCLK
jgi:hypothetical protein